jgi:hypothetical protein
MAFELAMARAKLKSGEGTDSYAYSSLSSSTVCPSRPLRIGKFLSSATLIVRSLFTLSTFSLIDVA